jgi:hypothetical protein
MVDGTLNVTEYTFHKINVCIGGSMHEEVDLLHDKADVQSTECQILKCSSETMILNGIRKWVAIGYRRFGLGVD